MQKNRRKSSVRAFHGGRALFAMTALAGMISQAYAQTPPADPTKVETARKTIPSLQHGRRFSVADSRAGPDYLHLVRGST